VVVRSRRPGDRFYPLGLGGSKKIKDFFISRKVPGDRKDIIPLLVSGGPDGDIVWVVGMAVDERFKISESTQKAVVVSTTVPAGL